MYSSGSYVSSISKTYGGFNAAEVYGASISRGNKWGASKIMSRTLATAGVLVADDAVVVGVFDDPAIPFVLVGGIIAAGVADIHDNGLNMKSDVTLLGIEIGLVSLSGYYDSFAKSKRGKTSNRQEDVKHGGPSKGIKGRGAKGDKHTARRAGDLSTKARQKPNWKPNRNRKK